MRMLRVCCTVNLIHSRSILSMFIHAVNTQLCCTVWILMVCCTHGVLHTRSAAAAACTQSKEIEGGKMVCASVRERVCERERARKEREGVKERVRKRKKK